MNVLSLSHFQQQAESIAKLIAVGDPYGPLGEERETNRMLAEAGMEGGWTVDCYRNWFAGFLRCARRMQVISPAQESDLYEIVQSAAELYWYQHGKGA
ncbi:hypothetical protein [Metapseudomonas resinovorans]|uniref:Uncharacterized protein n=1 Tax=Metapseudomonas resinovorans NBRC 106553 TaxID=1245471 RepID=S6AJG4_METRE|nr:hypothetical protein [Pseudomonas resinovorans]BAN48608.1 hypothetical protein PCA10_28760 [Pseudomonas resinovorans NBRC 106553]BAN48620.1 hypothetical protein PCA10_28880 [Pseudomonas resinovorans NBRC 106553]BAN48632.1 hypothetical protein PCA10_29000 [Pseudomonas resinovorans NBRC 106553]